mgnify:CR=1 FL=1
MISKTEKDTDKKKLIIQLTAKHLDELIQNAFGNYAIQHAFEVLDEKSSVEIYAFHSIRSTKRIVEKFGTKFLSSR